MRRLVQVLAVTLAFSMTLPALAAAECGTVFAIARLNASGSGTATGHAFVVFNGGAQTVSFESQIVGSNVEQTWHFAEGDVAVTEHPMPVLLPGPWQIIDSAVDVDTPNSGSWHYDGFFNEDTIRATFIVTGDLCI
jgi:hypothetical protein